jgi:hypothetical protein
MNWNTRAEGIKRLQKLLLLRSCQAERRVAALRRSYDELHSRLVALEVALASSDQGHFQMRHWLLLRYFTGQRSLVSLEKNYLASIREMKRAKLRLERFDKKLQVALREANFHELTQVIQDWRPQRYN